MFTEVILVRYLKMEMVKFLETCKTVRCSLEGR